MRRVEPVPPSPRVRPETRAYVLPRPPGKLLQGGHRPPKIFASQEDRWAVPLPDDLV